MRGNGTQQGEESCCIGQLAELVGVPLEEPVEARNRGLRRRLLVELTSADAARGVNGVL